MSFPWLYIFSSVISLGRFFSAFSSVFNPVIFKKYFDHVSEFLNVVATVISFSWLLVEYNISSVLFPMLIFFILLQLLCNDFHCFIWLVY